MNWERIGFFMTAGLFGSGVLLALIGIAYWIIWPVIKWGAAG